jgi:hypothetical protein
MNKTNYSMSRNGLSFCGKGKEKYVTFCPAHCPGETYHQYDYRNTGGELFSTIGKSLEDCRRRCDEWIQKKR